MNIETLRDECRKLPAVTEDIKWGHDLCFSLAGSLIHRLHRLIKTNLCNLWMKNLNLGHHLSFISVALNVSLRDNHAIYLIGAGTSLERS